MAKFWIHAVKKMLPQIMECITFGYAKAYISNGHNEKRAPNYERWMLEATKIGRVETNQIQFQKLDETNAHVSLSICVFFSI